MAVAIAIGALVAAIAPLYAMWLTLQDKVRSDNSITLVGRVKELEEQLTQCEARIDELERENVRLMRQLIARDPRKEGLV